MKFYLVGEEGNYCGYDNEYIIKSDKPFNEVEMFACVHADDRSAEEADYDEDEEDEPLHISCNVEEITEEEFKEKEKESYEVYTV